MFPIGMCKSVSIEGLPTELKISFYNLAWYIIFSSGLQSST
jgi:hypothetical protein